MRITVPPLLACAVIASIAVSAFLPGRKRGYSHRVNIKQVVDSREREIRQIRKLARMIDWKKVKRGTP